MKTDCRFTSEHARTVAHMLERKASDRWPDVRDEDVFECFLCKKWKPCWYYSYGLKDDTQMNASVLEYWKQYGHIWACDHCFKGSGLFACKQDGKTFTRCFNTKI